MSHVTSVDEVVRALLGSEHRARFREVSESILRDLTPEQCEALGATFRLSGTDGASTYLAANLTTNRCFVRILPASKRKRHVTMGYTFDENTWYSVPAGLGESLRNESAVDTGKFVALFQVESRPPLNSDGSGESVQWLL